MRECGPSTILTPDSAPDKAWISLTWLDRFGTRSLRTHPFTPDGRARPGETAVRTALSPRYLIRMRAEVQVLPGPPIMPLTRANPGHSPSGPGRLGCIRSGMRSKRRFLPGRRHRSYQPLCLFRPRHPAHLAAQRPKSALLRLTRPVRLPAYRRMGERRATGTPRRTEDDALLQSRRMHQLGSACDERNRSDSQLRSGYPAGDVTGFNKKAGRAGPGESPATPAG
jgi:hypothetical protein